ncbi:ABC transporter ATP-binding protein [Acrocarpospora phusangensis]|uniref:ABC transporter ATP-binding protein n=1 Tax=Acrocarpospora phusangensis TaxID=1070424 RepID=A0A919Q968_9ACTN|nr:ABC transporter ATP-binding protein [Acrocarpospora phusangensis]GIH24521.1 ABC transporter ATP-binding protein [Acrocarpospora phusangensis]
MTVLEVRDLTVRFGETPAVQGVAFEVARGEVLGVVGESGSGKSVSVLAVLGLLPRQAAVTGSVRLHGRELLGAPEKELTALRGRSLAMVFQDPLAALTPVHRIGDQVAEAILAHQDLPRKQARARAVDLLDLVGIPEPGRRARAFPHEFSGGMRQRVMIAMAVANDPDVIICDEPTTALDVTVQAQILDVLGTARRETGAAVVFVTHDLGVVAGLADRVMVLRAGRVEETAPVDDLFFRPRTAYTRNLLAAVPRIDRRHRRSAPPPGGERVLQVEGLVKRYGRGARAVDRVSFAVRAGETFGLVGESGCGKTTTLMEILALAAPQAGRIVVLGRDTAGLTRRERLELRRDLQVVFQDPMASLDPRMTVHDIVAEPLRAHGLAADRVPELLRLVGLDPGQAARYPQDFSGGQRQRIAIARALALAPRLLVLDEPVSALDVSIRAEVIALLADLKARLGLSYLLVAHDLALVRGIADRVAVMYAGRIVEIGPVEAVFAEPRHPYTRALLAAVPVPDPARERARRRAPLRGEPPGGAAAYPGGCRFRGRCPVYAELAAAPASRCVNEEPELGGADGAACHHPSGGTR